MIWGGGSMLGYMGVAAATWTPMGATVHMLTPKCAPKQFLGQQKMFGKANC